MNVEQKPAMVPKDPTYEKLSEGMTLPSLVKRPTTMTLFMFSAALWITHRIHYDQDHVRNEAGMKDVIVQGPLQASYLTQMITDWIGEKGTLKKFSFRNENSAFPGDVLTCHGVIKSKRREGKEGAVDLELWLNNQKGERLVSAAATVYIPL